MTLQIEVRKSAETLHLTDPHTPGSWPLPRALSLKGTALRGRDKAVTTIHTCHRAACVLQGPRHLLQAMSPDPQTGSGPRTEQQSEHGIGVTLLIPSCHFFFFKGLDMFPGGASGKEPACQCRRHKRRGFDPWVEKIPWRRAWQPTPVSLPGESHGQRSLGGYSPRGRRVGQNWSDLVHTQGAVWGCLASGCSAG